MRMAEHLLSVDHDALERPRCQERQHTHTCYKGGRKKCRFHAPFGPMPSTKALTSLQAPADDDEAGLKQYCFLKNTHDALHSARHSALDTTSYQSFAEMLQHHDIRIFDKYEEVIRSGLARPTLLLKRDMDQTNVNPFNSWIASVLKSNMDIQVILDVHACASYVVEYVNKANRGVSNLG
ncbi:hypothetical protein MRX96_016686 [Rhipicephalus microplus]